MRFRPIMMTTMAALMGALPIAVGWGAGAATRRPLGVAVVGGLAFSQLVTLYVTPVFYTYLDELQQRFSRRRAKERAGVTPPPDAKLPQGAPSGAGGDVSLRGATLGPVEELPLERGSERPISRRPPGSSRIWPGVRSPFRKSRFLVDDLPHRIARVAHVLRGLLGAEVGGKRREIIAQHRVHAVRARAPSHVSRAWSFSVWSRDSARVNRRTGT